jgi:hypothetical protein
MDETFIMQEAGSGKAEYGRTLWSTNLLDPLVPMGSVQGYIAYS